jgi:hypothetical protein
MSMVPRILLLATISMFAPGCMTPPHDPNRPPKRPEEFRVPPDQDARFTKPVEYPKGLLNMDILQTRMAKNAQGGNKGPAPGGRPGTVSSPGNAQ